MPCGSARYVDVLEHQRRDRPFPRVELRFDDPEYVEQQARSRFGWVMPGEIGFTVLGADGKPVGKGPELPDAPPAATAGPQWHETLWGSVEVAGGVPDKTTPTPSDEVVTPKKQDEGQ